MNSKEDLFWRVRRLLNLIVPNDLESHIGNGTTKKRKERIKKRKTQLRNLDSGASRISIGVFVMNYKNPKVVIIANPNVHTM